MKPLVNQRTSLGPQALKSPCARCHFRDGRYGEMDMDLAERHPGSEVYTYRIIRTIIIASFARPKWPTCSCNTTVSLTRWDDLQQLCGKPMEKKQKKREIQGTTMENAQDLRENHRKNTWLVIIIPHCMAMYTTAPWTQTYHDTPR